MLTIRLGQIACARSGDKGAHSNIGVIARSPVAYPFLVEKLTTDVMLKYFKPLGVTRVVRYELPNLHALNFLLYDILDAGGSVTLRTDAQGKAFGQTLLEMKLDVPDHLVK
jgi:hypothetical protein